MANKKKVSEKVAGYALVATEVGSEALAIVEDQPWSGPVQLALFTLKMIILMYLKSAEQKDQPAPDGAADSLADSPAELERRPVDADEETARDEEPDDPADEQQPHPQ
ncbi:hypothetical protein ACFFQW_44545 [Umezawaea endophytica]|uniref:Uncharacterized protein n=1 Tax=Umezawaea endophytica TaxID=1654476 RepID=A0A9X3ALQ4_9PSEU|nr:hypothetical protein [Umezawaea endophytica]MCS7484845.1 hypothetical protein [Umezawaea endophytica]